MMLGLDDVDNRLQDVERQPEPAREIAAGQLPAHVQRLERELHQQLDVQTGLFERARGRRDENHLLGSSV
jgi:hypothetical protein